MHNLFVVLFIFVCGFISISCFMSIINSNMEEKIDAAIKRERQYRQ